MNEYKPIAGDFLSKYVLTLRTRLGLTQEQMAEQLRISARAYRNLEYGRYCCSGTTLLFLLLLLEDNEVHDLLGELRKKILDFEHDSTA